MKICVFGPGFYVIFSKGMKRHNNQVTLGYRKNEGLLN
jgi:hypothetical protein